MDDVTSRWIRTPGDEKAAARGCYFAEKRADHIVTFFEEHLRHIESWCTGRAGQKFRLMPWQRDEVLKPLFGWMRPDGTRRFRRAYIEVPKKNGKTPLCSGIALYMLAADGESGAQVYCAASDIKQAGLVFRHANSMAVRSPLLKNYVKSAESIKRLILPSTESFLQALSSEGFRQEGINAHCVIFDELHAQPTRELWDALLYASASRLQPMQVAITTAGWDRETICFEVHEHAARVLQGAVEDESFFGFICAADPGDDWKSPETWKKANPSLGVTITLENMEADCKSAADSPAAENTFKRYRLNLWTESERRWIPWDKWLASAGTVDEAELVGQPCYAGLDLAKVHDLTALVLVFPREGGSYKVLPFFFAPRENAQKRERNDGVPYLSWEQNGYLELTDGDVTDYAFVLKRIIELAEKYDIKELAFDPWNAQHLINELNAFGGPPTVAFQQTIANFNEPMKAVERAVLKGTFHHGRNPIFDWMATNVAVRMDPSGNIRPDKEKSRDRIDGIVAAIMATARAGMAVQKRSVYETRGLLRI